MLDRTPMKLLALVLLASCVEATESEPGPVDDVIARPPPPGESDQGRYLNGSITDPLAINGYHHHTSRQPSFVPATSGTVTRIEAASGRLTAFDGPTPVFSSSDTRFEGITLPLVGAATGTVLRIANISTSDPRAPYVIDIVTNGVATPYCKDRGPAFASTGRWTVTGKHEEASTLNFTCFDGVIWKCFTWGYDPGTSSLNTPDPRDDPWRVHQACTRMARADRCGDGTPNTFEETSIVIRDRVPYGQPNIDDPTVPPLRVPTVDPPPPNVYWFEAAWTMDGAMCLSRERWNSMPLDEDSCPHLPDPRKDPLAETCDQIGIDTLTTTATFFNSSKIGQLYLNRWSKANDQLVTVRGMAGEGANAEPPFPGYVFQEQIGLLMRNPPGSMALPVDPDPDLEAVAMYRAGVDRVVSDAAPTGAHTLGTYEGFVYTDQYVTANPTMSFLELHLYRKGTDYVTAVDPPDATWSDEGRIGYIDLP